jgi:RHS repeat-associated protein
MTSGSTLSRYSYTGRESDADVSLMYYRARWYDRSKGRFVSEDPIGLTEDIDLYSYVSNNAINFSDPSGLERLQLYHFKSRTPSNPSGCTCGSVDYSIVPRLMASYGKGVVTGFAGAAVGTVSLPINFVSDPSGTLSSIVDDIGMRITTMGQVIADPIQALDAITDAIVDLGPNRAMETLGDAGGQVIFFETAGNLGQRVRRGKEPWVRSCRIAPLGNATKHPYGRWPHYHRRGPKGPDGKPLPGQGIGRHRPFERSKHDKRLRDRF